MTVTIARTKNFIAGEWVGHGNTIANINPSDTSDEIGRYEQASSQDVQTAIQSAFDSQKVWANIGLEQRQAALMFIGNELMARATELGRELSREEGKTIPEGRGEVYRSGQFFTYYAAEILRQIGENAQSVRPGIDIDIRREPVGTIAVVSPWNFPMAAASWKIAPALAFGNAVIWKPANLTPTSAVALADIIARSGLPKGVFNLLMGPGSSVGQELISSPEVKAVTFTGSVPVGRRVAASASANFTKIQLEMGSKNALVVMNDCDLDLAVSHAINGAFFGTGQKCTASSRLVVHEAIHDAFTDKLVATAKALRVGHALEEGIQIGPVVSEEQLQSNLAYVEIGKSEGAALVAGGGLLSRATKGYFMEPAIFVDTSNQMKINREEIFGPVASVIKVGSYEEALTVVNDTKFGLTAGIMTKSLAQSTHFQRNAKTGCVMVNLPTAGTDYHVPFGGRGESSYGPREQGQYAREFYTNVKTSYICSGKPE